MTSYYDVVVLGTDLAPLTCAALLSKRGFRVAVLGQQTDRPDYAVGRFRCGLGVERLRLGRPPRTDRSRAASSPSSASDRACVA